LGLEAGRTITLKRYTLWGDREIELQCRTSRSGLSLYRLLRGMTTADSLAMWS
jgi:hypothetical protein